MPMKQAIRDHYYAYGRTRGFLTTHARLSEGLKGPAEPSGLDLSRASLPNTLSV
jgi:hypothetical protein